MSLPSVILNVESVGWLLRIFAEQNDERDDVEKEAEEKPKQGTAPSILGPKRAKCAAEEENQSDLCSIPTHSADSRDTGLKLFDPLLELESFAAWLLCLSLSHIDEAAERCKRKE